MAFALDALFDQNPPVDPALRRQLFIGREYELRLMSERIPGSLRGRIRAIHGPSRVGKSHLALLFLHELKGLNLFTVNAASGLAAKIILRDLYDQLRDRFEKLYEQVQLEVAQGRAIPSCLQRIDPDTKRPPLPGVNLDETVSSVPILEEALAFIDETDQLLPGESLSAEESTTGADEDSLGGSLGVKGAGIEVGLSGGAKRAVGTGTKIVRPPLDELVFTRRITRLCEDLALLTGQQVLVYIDDVDLLERRPSSTKLAHEEVALLTRCLHRLASSGSITVATSLRTRNLRIDDKELSGVVEVEPLTADEMKRVYQNHIGAFNEGAQVMDEECQDELGLHANGMVGNFLRLCRELRDWGLKFRQGQCLKKDDLDSYFQYRIRRLLAVPDNRPYIEAIKAALKAAVYEVALDPAVLDTDIAYILLEEPLGSYVPRTFTISHLARRALKAIDPAYFATADVLASSPGGV